MKKNNSTLLLLLLSVFLVGCNTLQHRPEAKLESSIIKDIEYITEVEVGHLPNQEKEFITQQSKQPEIQFEHQEQIKQDQQPKLENKQILYLWTLLGEVWHINQKQISDLN